MDEPYHDVTGSGPVLLVVPGGAGHPMGLDAMTGRLAERFTVVMYDPLGLAHGRTGEGVSDQRVADWADGAHRLLEAVLPEGESAYVFGTSSGGIAVLDLLARHPGRLRHVVAHEPPCMPVLPDGAGRRAELIRQVTEGRPAPGAAGPLTPMDVFVGHVLRPFTRYAPGGPLAAGRLTVAAGAESKGQDLYRAAEAVADITGAVFSEFPGGHLGALTHAVAFADAVSTALAPSGA